jgi:endonuclease/exonuclease/phosphatase family metal-dependent hydrolase
MKVVIAHDSMLIRQGLVRLLADAGCDVRLRCRASLSNEPVFPTMSESPRCERRLCQSRCQAQSRVHCLRQREQPGAWEATMAVRIGTWNLENFFRPAGGVDPATDPNYQAKLKALSDVITAIAPDVLAVQEVGDVDALTDLAARIGGTWQCETAAPDGRGIRVGFMSRRPMTLVEPVTAFPAGVRPIQVDDTATAMSSMGRPALRVRVHLGGRALDLICCHLKSKLLSFPGGRFSTNDEGERARFADYALNRRAAEAVTVRAAATQLLMAGLAGGGNEASVVVLGDFNDEPVAATTQILQGPPGSEIGTGGFDHVDQGDGQRLWNLAARIPEAQRFSRVYRTRHELIDHIFVSHALVGQVPDGAVTTDGAGPVPSIADVPGQTPPAAGSDHRPVIATIDL